MVLASPVTRGGSILQLIGVLLIFVFVLVLTYFTTRWIASFQKARTFNNNLKIVETLRVTPNKYIQIVRAGDEYLVIGIGKEEITLLTKLTEEQLKDWTDQDVEPVQPIESFKEMFEKIKNHNLKK